MLSYANMDDRLTYIPNNDKTRMTTSIKAKDRSRENHVSPIALRTDGRTDGQTK